MSTHFDDEFGTIRPEGRGGGGHMSKFLTGMLLLYFGFKIWPNPIFLGWQIFSYFSGFCKISAIFGGLTNFQLFFWSSNFCITHLNPLNEKHTSLKNKIIVAFHIYSNFDHHFIFSHSIFFLFEFWGILYFWV